MPNKKRKISKKVKKTATKYKMDRSVPIGLLQPDAELNDDKIIPTCSSTLQSRTLRIPSELRDSCRL